MKQYLPDFMFIISHLYSSIVLFLIFKDLPSNIYLQTRD